MKAIDQFLASLPPGTRRAVVSASPDYVADGRVAAVEVARANLAHRLRIQPDEVDVHEFRPVKGDPEDGFVGVALVGVPKPGVDIHVPRALLERLLSDLPDGPVNAPLLWSDGGVLLKVGGAALHCRALSSPAAVAPTFRVHDWATRIAHAVDALYSSTDATRVQ